MVQFTQNYKCISLTKNKTLWNKLMLEHSCCFEFDMTGYLLHQYVGLSPIRFVSFGGKISC